MSQFNYRHENNVYYWTKKMKHSSAWKDLERAAAKALGGERVCRAGNFAQSATDVVIDDFPQLKIDTKRRKQNFKHHSMLKEIEGKYCGDADIAILITKNHSERGAVASLAMRNLARLLDAIRKLRVEIRTLRIEIRKLSSRERLENEENMGAVCPDERGP
jgi:hypothetical protein